MNLMLLQKASKPGTATVRAGGSQSSQQQQTSVWANAPLVVLPLHIHKPAGSICSMKRNTHVFIPEEQFRLLSGADNLACYQVGVPA